MTQGEAASLDEAFAAALAAPEPGRAPAGLLGLEHEYSLSRDGREADFRALIHSLPIPGARLDPGDVNAYRLPSGISLTADGAEAEVASPPVPVRPGFTGEVQRWASAARAQLEGVLPPGARLSGYSTHLSASMPASLADGAAGLYAVTFAPALGMLLDGPESHGVYVRPRPGRLELCGEFADGPHLGAVAAFAAGSARACAFAASGAAPPRPLPPRLDIEVLPGVERYGLRVRRDAPGFDLYAAGRGAALRRQEGGTITAGEAVRAAWECARHALDSRAAPSDLAVMDRIAAGDLPLGIEGEATQPAAHLPAGQPHDPLGAVLQRHSRPGLGIAAVIATWDFTVFRLTGAPRMAFASVPRRSLPAFLARLHAGDLDELLGRYVAAAPSGRVLAQHEQTAHPGLYDEVAEPTGLLAPERDPGPIDSPVTRPGKSEGDRPGKSRPGKRVLPLPPLPGDSGREPEGGGEAQPPLSAPPPSVPPPPPPTPPPAPEPPSTPPTGVEPRPLPWPAIVAGAVGAVVAVAVAGAVILGQGGGGEPSPTPTPVRTESPAATRPAETPTRPTATETPRPTATPLRPTETTQPTAIGAGGTTPTPTRVTESTPTPKKTETPPPTATPTATERPSPTPTPTEAPTATPTPTTRPTKTVVPPTATPGCTPSPGTTC